MKLFHSLQRNTTFFLLFSCSVMSNSLQSHGLQHARLPCPSLSPRVCSDSVHWVGDAIQPSVTHYSSCPQSFPASGYELAVRVSWPKYWGFSTSPYNEYSGLTLFRIDWFDLLAVQGTLKSLFQHHSLKASILWRLAFFMVQLSQLYMTSEKNHSYDHPDLCQQSDVSAF